MYTPGYSLPGVYIPYGTPLGIASLVYITVCIPLGIASLVYISRYMPPYMPPCVCTGVLPYMPPCVCTTVVYMPPKPRGLSAP